MSNPFPKAIAAGALTMLLAACGGSSSDDAGNIIAPPPGGGAPTTGTVGIMFTDGPTDEFDRILVTVNEVSLLPADEDADPVNIFSGEETFDLLELRDFTDLFAVAEDVPAGDYRKVRMRLAGIDLVELDEAGDPVRTVAAQLTGNGKLDLNPRDGGPFTLEGGQTLLIRLDMDAEKSFLVIRAGASGRYLFRPVVFVDIDTGELRDRLVRLFGEVGEVVDANAGEFTLCELQRIQGEGVLWDGCILIRVDEDGAIFDTTGLAVDIANLEAGDPASAVGFFGESEDELRVLEALVVQLGLRDALERLSGFTDTAIGSDGLFSLLLDPGQGIADELLTVALQPGAALITREGERLDPASVGVGAEVHAEGVLSVAEAQLRASLVVVNEAGEAEVMLRGVIQTLDEENRELTITVDEAGDRCVRLAEDGEITRIREDEEGGTVTEPVEFADLEVGATVDAFGLPAVDGCFDATSLVIDEATDEEAQED